MGHKRTTLPRGKAPVDLRLRIQLAPKEERLLRHCAAELGVSVAAMARAMIHDMLTKAEQTGTLWLDLGRIEVQMPNE